MNLHVLWAVFRRNFVGYFANPTGYLFICLFVFLGAYAAFWVPDFFGNNLANLDQLSLWFPFIMLVFIPTITMGIWADERKQGTDELLLTIPAADFDVVLGKYLAAVGIFTVSLLFSLCCNYLVLNNLASDESGVILWPRLDLGLFLSTYVGYWLVGLAMLAVGVIASFLTNNITIGFVLGVLFNMPLVYLGSVDAIFGGVDRTTVQSLKSWSIAERFSDFSHGVLTLSAVVYFATILVVMLYISMALIGRRHWFCGPNRWRRANHYVIRTIALAAIGGGAVFLLQQHDLRGDISSAKLSSLAPQTRALIENLKADRPVKIEAFVSPVVPESYVQTRLNLLSTLRELQALGGDKVKVQIHETTRYSPEAALAAKRYGIEPRPVDTLNHGTISRDFIFLNVAVRCGLQRTPPVFIDRGIPAEYELVRSIMTVSQQQRKKLGILQTDAQLYGSFNMQTMSPTPNWPIIDELEKQYEVVKVDPSKPITKKFDVLLAIQPSSLGPQEMDHFIAAVAAGQPTAIFEDPAPVFGSGAPATSQPRQAPGGMNPMMMQMQQAPPKGDINKLWNLLGVSFDDRQVIWQDYNPYPKITDFTRDKEFVFVDAGSGAKDALSDRDPISSGLQQILFPFPGSISKLNTSSLNFTPLVRTSDKTGTVQFGELMQMTPFGPRGGLNPNRRWIPTSVSYVLAAHIQGKVEIPEGDQPAKTAKESKDEKKPHSGFVNVVVVSDLDMLSPAFFQLRERGEMPELGINFRFDNVTFVLNALDELSGDQRFVDIRKRRPLHRTLMRIEERTKEARQKAAGARDQFNQEFKAEEDKQEQAILDKIAELKKEKNVDPQELLIRVSMMQQDLERQRQSKLEQLRERKDQKINQIEAELTSTVRKVQDRYKMWAVLLPPIPPLLVAVIVFFTRRAREREGVSRSRLR
ncbi:MAG: Gldg family protein [Planctomycetaceae bacterium]|nr:Gldg family protein [Planctomycetaceae bacterium]